MKRQALKKIRVVLAAMLMLMLSVVLVGCGSVTRASDNFTLTADVLEYHFDVGEEDAAISLTLNVITEPADGSNYRQEFLWYSGDVSRYDELDEIEAIALEDLESGVFSMAIDTSQEGTTYYYAQARNISTNYEISANIEYADSPIIKVVVGEEASAGGYSVGSAPASSSSSTESSTAESSSSTSSSSAAGSGAAAAGSSSSSGTPPDNYRFYIMRQPGPGPIRFDTGSQVVISVEAYSSSLAISESAYDVFNFQWYTNTANSTEGAVMLAGQTTHQLTIASQNPSSQFYFCVVTDPRANQTRQTGITHVIVEGVPVAAQGQNWVQVSISPSGGAVGNLLTATASGAGAISYQWYIYDEGRATYMAIPGQNGASYTIGGEALDGTHIVCMATSTLNGSGISAYSNMAELIS